MRSLRNLLELAVIQFRIEAAFFEKLLMAATFDYIPVIHNQDYIGIFNRGKTVSDDELRSALHQLFHYLLYQQLSSGIDRARRLVKYKHRGVFDHGSRYYSWRKAWLEFLVLS